MKISTIYNKAKGFTLIELLVVIAILATLAAVGYPLVMSQLDKAKLSQAQDSCVKLVSGVENFMADNGGDYPFATPENKRSRSNVVDLGKDNYLVETADGKDGGMIRVLINQEEDDRGRLNRAGNVYITASIAEDKGDTGIYMNPDTQEPELYDPWGRPFYVIVCPDKTGCYDPFTGMRVPGKKCLAYTLGPDGAGEPDINALSAFLKSKGKGKKFRASQVDDDDDDNPMADNIYSWKHKK